MKTYAILTFRAVALCIALLGTNAYAVGQASFQTADAAVDAFVKALKADDRKALLEILGPDAKTLINSGDPVVDERMRSEFLSKYDAKHMVTPDGDTQATLAIGVDDWPLPVPLVKQGAGWQFDTKAGARQIIDRRIGRDEIAAIRTALAYVDAQTDYFDRAKRGLGTGLYAQRLVSTPGHYDGLFWPTGDGVPASPLEPLVQQAATEGYPSDPVAGKPVPFEGYDFHVLKAQGGNAEGGEKDYIVDGKMTGGFALIAWPAIYGSSGVMTFIVNQDGIVFQKDLGPDTAKLAGAMTRFDPDISWARVSMTEK